MAGQQQTAGSTTSASSQEVTVPVVKEQMQVGKREVQEGATRVQKRIIEKPVEKSVTLKDENVRVEQRSANRPVKDPDKAFKGADDRDDGVEGSSDGHEGGAADR